MWAIFCTNKLLLLASEPKSYQCSARMPGGPNSLSRNIFAEGGGDEPSDFGSDTRACGRAGGSGSVG